MKRWAFVLGALAIGMAESSRQAEASYSIIRWTSGFCQVWDNSTPWKPFPSDYIVGPILFGTFDEAMARKMQLVAHRECW